MATNELPYKSQVDAKDISSKKENASARISTPRPHLPLYLSRHLQACLLTLGYMARVPISSVMIIFVIGIAFALPLGLWILIQNTHHLSQNWDNSAQISLYLKMQTSDEQTQSLLKQLKKRPDISKVIFVSPKQGLAEFREQFNFGDALALLKNNPLPGVILITPSLREQNLDTIPQLLTSLQQLPQVDTAKLDMQWVKRLHALLNMANRVVYAFGCLLGLGVFLVIGSIIHLATQNQRKEIEVYQLVGATNSFIRRPFLYTGMMYSLFGAIAAWFIITLFLLWLKTPALELTHLYQSDFQLHGFSPLSVTVFFTIAIILGLASAWLAVSRQLNSGPC